ncbi:MAG: winged helix-turn-helix transcriptional regulator [Clostridia bacterium]|nr:winged helix-turn-helix transcriptional regulator [Clostridia bacterium]
MHKYLLLSNESEKKILQYIPTNRKFEKLALFFHNFSDSTRLKIISCLSMCDMCVSDLSAILCQNQTTISHQLKLLKDQNIVECKRDGKILVYHLTSSAVNELMLIAGDNTL